MRVGHVPRPWGGNHKHREGCVAGATESGRKAERAEGLQARLAQAGPRRSCQGLRTFKVYWKLLKCLKKGI